MNRFLLLLCLMFISSFVFSSQLFDWDEKEKKSYLQRTSLSFYAGYSFYIPLEESIENPFKSGAFSLGCISRNRIVNNLDWGLGLGYGKRRSFIKKNRLSSLDENMYFNKINTYHHYFNADAFLRCNFPKKIKICGLKGYFLDLGISYKYAFGYGNKFVYKSKEELQRHKFMRPKYLSPQSYGPFVRFGFNYVSLIVSYDFEEWIRSYGVDNHNYNRGNLQVGIQLNFY